MWELISHLKSGIKHPFFVLGQKFPFSVNPTGDLAVFVVTGWIYKVR